MDFPNEEITLDLFSASCQLAEELSVYNAHPGVVNGHDPLVVITALFMFVVDEGKKMHLSKQRMHQLVELCHDGVEGRKVQEH